MCDSDARVCKDCAVLTRISRASCSVRASLQLASAKARRVCCAISHRRACVTVAMSLDLRAQGVSASAFAVSDSFGTGVASLSFDEQVTHTNDVRCTI
jgi:hypothetical protein